MKMIGKPESKKVAQKAVMVPRIVLKFIPAFRACECWNFRPI